MSQTGLHGQKHMETQIRQQQQQQRSGHKGLHVKLRLWQSICLSCTAFRLDTRKRRGDGKRKNKRRVKKSNHDVVDVNKRSGNGYLTIIGRPNYALWCHETL